MRYAAIDIGSNAVRLLISEVSERSSGVDFKKVLFVRVPLRLGTNAFLDKKIGRAKTNELVKVMVAFKNLIDVHQVDEYKACATAAMREATNSKEVVAEVREKTKIKIEIIEGKTEAEMIYSNHVAESLDTSGSYLYIDVGGGSTELTVFSKGEIIDSNSFKIGTVRILNNVDKKEDWDQLKNWLKTTIPNIKNLVGIGTGGNINKIFKISGKKENKSITLQEIKTIYNYLSTLTIEQMIHDLGMNEDRADVILPASKIFLTIMKWASMGEIYVPRLGLADGIIHYLYEKNTAKKPKA